jgi:LemA protein
MHSSRALIRVTALTAGLLLVTSCDNHIIASEQKVNLALGNLQSQYQRRIDLVPNLVETVKAAATQERATLEAVIQARANATQTRIEPGDLSDPAKFEAFQKAQGQLSASLRQLLVVSEQYPDLKSSQGFRDLQVQLEGTENRIARSREEYNQAVVAFNTTILTFPSRLVAGGRKQKQVFQAEAAASEAPKVKF